MRLLLTTYALGILVGLWRTDGPPLTKLALALLWPIGPIAFAITISGLVIAGIIALVARALTTRTRPA